jgi:hypothetical protein
MAPGAQRL